VTTTDPATADLMDGTRQPRVLIVDDAPDIRSLFGRWLTHSGITVAMAEDGLVGLASARVQPFDAIVCDLDMPRMDGVALCRALRQDPTTKDVPILVVSGAVGSQGNAALLAGCDAVLAKPCSCADLVSTIERLLAHARPVQARGAAGGDHVTDQEREGTIAALRGLIEALDRRTPRLLETGEAQIAQDAAALRQEAEERITALSRAAHA
jgi:CheY-like chemotaxis protein